MANDFNPDWASPPGDTIQDILDERGIGALRFRLMMGMTTEQVDQLICGQLAIDAKLAMMLACVLGSTQRFWLKREEQYRATMSKIENVRRAAMARLGYSEIEPIGKRKTFGHQNRGNRPHIWGEFEVYEYPEIWEGKRLRALRLELDLNLGTAARMLGLGVAQFSSLETGIAVCNWKLVEQELRDSARDLAILVAQAKAEADGP